MLKDVACRADGAVTQHVVVRRRKGLAAERDECRSPTTDPKGAAGRPCRPYGRRMTIEQLFGGHASRRNGRGLRDAQVGTPRRLDRRLRIPATAYLSRCGPGLTARNRYKPSAWCASSKERCSVFLIGLLMRERINASPPQAFMAVLDLSVEVAGKWG